MGTIYKSGIYYSGGGQIIQVAALPIASITEEGNIYQYIGTTDTNYTNGYFYECVEITPATDPKTYEWVRKDVQPGGSSGVSTGWGIAKVGITSVTFNNSKWSTSSTIDVSDLGFTSGSDYEVLTQPITGGTMAPWGSSISFIGADKGATSFKVSAYTMESTGSGTVNAKYIVFAKGYGTDGQQIRATNEEVTAVVNKYF